MKKALKITLIILFTILVSIIGFTIYCIFLTKDVKLDEKKLINLDNSISYLYSNGEIIKEESKGVEIGDIGDIPEHVKKAFISIEDKRFYSHKGVDFKGLIRATAKNVFSLSLKEGGSTITQQLIKNTHLTNDKTLKRKIAEIKLSLILEKKYSKDEILEKYLNTIYFGSGKYGITEASKYYFSKSPKELTINEGAVLASIIKAPSTYSPIYNESKCLDRKNLILKEMFEQDYVTHNQYVNCKELSCETKLQNENNSYIDLIKKELNEILNDTPYYLEKIEVLTSIDKEKQNVLEENFNDIPYKFSAVSLNRNNQINAFISSTPLEKRQVGSTIKPLAVYGPAIDLNLIYPATKILDEKCDFNGYSPSNYGNKYHGYVSIKDAIAKSLNVPCVKILNDMGTDKAIKYLNKMEFPLEKNDNSLALGLGATEKGANILDLSSCYTTFINDGYYQKYGVIDEILCNNKTIYKNEKIIRKVFEEDTASIINDYLSATAKEGTAKKLSSLPFPIYAKTGTVGSSKGNTDVYNISYTNDGVLGVWIGNNDKEYLANNISGGNLPTEKAVKVWKDFYKNNNYPTKIPLSKKLIEENIDKISYDKENVIILADKNTPERYKIKAYFRPNYLPIEKSNRFTCPKVDDYKIELIDNTTKISCNHIDVLNLLIYRTKNNEKSLIFDGKTNISPFIDSNIEFNSEYVYSIVPYYDNGKEKFYGKEIVLSKIKTPPMIGGDDWWINDDLDYN